MVEMIYPCRQAYIAFEAVARCLYRVERRSTALCDARTARIVTADYTQTIGFIFARQFREKVFN